MKQSLSSMILIGASKKKNHLKYCIKTNSHVLTPFAKSHHENDFDLQKKTIIFTLLHNSLIPQ